MHGYVFHFMQHVTVPFFARAAGVYSATPSSGAPPDGFGSILLVALMGAFCGLIVGFLIAHVLRYFSFLLNRNLGGYGWVLICVVVGAIGFGLAEAFGGKD